MFKGFEYYKPDFVEVIRRFDEFYGAVSEGRTGNFIYRALLDSDIAIYNNLKLNTYDFENGIDRYIKDVSRETENVYAVRRDVKDDTLPAISPILGIGDYSAFVDGEIVFGEDTSWSQPVLKRLEDWRNLQEVGNAKWYCKFMHISQKLMEQVKGTDIPFMRGFFSPLDLAHALRGVDIYTDFFDNSDEVHRFLDFCADATIKFAEELRSKVYDKLGESQYATWLFKDCINMSEDIACMISPEIYREFEAPYTQKVIDHFGDGYLHCHSRALYIVPELCRLRNVKNIWIASDPNQTEPVSVLKELIGKANNVCLSIDCDLFEKVEKNIDIAKEGNIAFCTPVKSIDDANRNTDFIRKHSNK
jgi:Uroporphyrinogen-III decarboxylase